MKNKKSLLSVLLAAVLLCACVAGVLITGASAEVVTTTYYVDSEAGDDTTPVADADDGNLTFATVRGAVNYAGTQEWGANEDLCIKIKDATANVVKASNVVWATTAGRIEREGSGLPITITSFGTEPVGIEFLEISSSSGVGNLYLFNDYIFDNINFTCQDSTDDTANTYKIWCGGARTEFKNCTFDTVETCAIYANGNTFEGWKLTKDTIGYRMVNGKITNEVIFSGDTVTTDKVSIYASGEEAGTKYFSETNKIMDGETEVASISQSDFSGKVTVKGSAQVAKLYGTMNKLGEATVEIDENAVVTILYGANGKLGTLSGNALTVNINGGKLSEFWGLYTGNTTGPSIGNGANVTVNVNGGTSHGNFYLLYTKYGTFSVMEGGKFNVNVNDGAKIGTLTALYCSCSNAATISVEGEINLDINGGTTGNIVLTNSTKATNASSAVINGTVNLDIRNGALTGVVQVGKTSTKCKVSESGVVNITADNASHGELCILQGGAVCDGTVNYTFRNNATTSKDFYVTYGAASIGENAKIKMTFDNITTNKTIYGYYVNAKTAAGSIAGDIEYNLKNAKFTKSDKTLHGAYLSITDAADPCTETASATINVYDGTEVTGSGKGNLMFVNGVNDKDAEGATDEIVTLDATLNVYGGVINGTMRPVDYATLNGDLTVKIDSTVEGGAAVTTGGIQLGWSSPVTGKIDFDAKGSQTAPITFASLYGGSPAAGATFDLENVTVTGNFHTARDNAFDADVTTTMTDVVISGNFVGGGTTIAIGAGGPTGEVANTLTRVTIAGDFIGGSAANTLVPSKVTNIVTDCTIGGAFLAGSRTGNAEGIVSSELEGNIIAGPTYAGDRDTVPAQETLIIKSGTFGGKVTGKKVVLNTDAAITIQGEGAIAATDVGENVTVTKVGAWGSFDKIYLSAPANADITIALGEGADENYYKDTTVYEVRGWYLNPEISLILGQRVELKAIIDKALADEYIAKLGTPAFTFKLGGVDQAVSAEKLVENGENYEVIFAAAGAGDFDLPLEYVFSGKSVATTTIQELAAAGANIYKDTPNEAIFKALVDYGAAANGAAELTYFDATSLDLSKLVVATGAVKGETELQLSGITLLMGDTLGIRYKLSGDAAGVAVKFNGEALAADLYAVSGNNLDIFVSAETLNNLMPVEILDASGNTVVAVDYAVSNIAAKIYEADNTNLKAAAVLELVLAMEAAKTVA